MSSPSYALTPGHFKADDPVDLSDKLGREIYNRAVEPLKVPFDGTSKNIHLLQSQLKIRAKKSGWDKGTGDIINITTVGGKKNVIFKYGWFSLGVTLPTSFAFGGRRVGGFSEFL